jgi:hypothetical protein
MRAFLLLCFVSLALDCSVHRASAATGKIIKVLPQFLDLQGRNALSPSLYDRDAYQVILREHPERRSGVAFNIDFKVKGPVSGDLKVILQLRGIATGEEPQPQRMVVHKKVEPTHWFGKWTAIKVNGEDYQNLGEITAWRVTLWEGNNLLSEQKSFLWKD